MRSAWPLWFKPCGVEEGTSGKWGVKFAPVTLEGVAGANFYYSIGFPSLRQKRVRIVPHESFTE